MRSAERHHGARRAAVLTVLLAAGPLAGCATTQQEAARLQLNSARIRASEVAVVVHKAGPAVVAGAVAMITGTAGSAVLVVVRNRTRSPIGDLPISVGILAAGGARAGCVLRHRRHRTRPVGRRRARDGAGFQRGDA